MINNMQELLKEIKEVYPTNWIYNEQDNSIYNSDGKDIRGDDYSIIQQENGYTINWTGDTIEDITKERLVKLLKNFYDYDNEK